MSRTKSGMYAQNCALTIYDEIKTCRRAEAHPDMRTGLFRWNIALNTGSGSGAKKSAENRCGVARTFAEAEKAAA